MTSKDIVLQTLAYASPERVARSFRDEDLIWCGNTARTHATPWRAVAGGSWESTDEWGNTWRRIEANSKGEVARGVLDDLARVETYEFPDYSRQEDYDCVREVRAGRPDKFLLGALPGFAFNIARKMRRMDQYLADILIERETIHRLHDRIDAVVSDMIRNYAQAGADAVMFCEDWGTQSQTLVSPQLWHEEFFPRFRNLCALAHDGGIRVFMHSCGQTEEIVPGLIEAGIDCLQFDQPDLHTIDALARHQEGARITFWCPVDIQTTLQTRNEPVIRAKVREMLDKLWKGRGGFIAGYYPDNASIGLDPKWQEIACDEFLARGPAAQPRHLERGP